MKILYTGYQSNDPFMGMVEYQRTAMDKDEFIETWDKKPTGNKYTEAMIKELRNNGFKWTSVTAEGE